MRCNSRRGVQKSRDPYLTGLENRNCRVSYPNMFLSLKTYTPIRSGSWLSSRLEATLSVQVAKSRAIDTTLLFPLAPSEKWELTKWKDPKSFSKCKNHFNGFLAVGDTTLTRKLMRHRNRIWFMPTTRTVCHCSIWHEFTDGWLPGGWSRMGSCLTIQVAQPVCHLILKWLQRIQSVWDLRFLKHSSHQIKANRIFRRAWLKQGVQIV